MNSGVVIPSIDVLSNEQSNISTQQEHTSRMIKEMKQFKKKHFYKMKEIQSLKSTFHKKSHSRKNNSKILFDLSTFHMTTLRDCIYNKTHSGSNFLDIPTSTRVKLFLERKNKHSDQFTTTSDNATFSSNTSKKNQQSTTQAKTRTSKQRNDNNNNIRSLPKLLSSDNCLKYNSRNKNHVYCSTSPSNKEKSKTRNYFFNLYSTYRNETIDEFIQKSRSIRVKRLINHIIKDNYSKYKNDRVNNMDLVRADIYNYSTGYDYLKRYASTSDDYFEHLYKQIKLETYKLERYKEQRIKLMNEAHKINVRLNHMQVRFNSNFRNKFFLMCVKNETSQPHLFCEEDKIEYEKDMQKLHFLMNIGSIEISNPTKAEENETLIEKEMKMFIDSNNKPIYPVFTSIEHFLLNLSKISSRVTKLMSEYNECEEYLKHLRNELEIAKLEVRENKKIDLFWENEIDEKEKKLNEVKTKYIALTNFYNNLPGQKEFQLNLLFNTITKKYNEIKQKSIPIPKSTLNFLNHKKRNDLRERNKNTIALEQLKYIEVIVNYLITLSKTWHNENTQKFLFAKKEVEKIKRIKATKILKEKELIKIQSKIQEILDKNNKIVILPKKKAPEKSMVNNNSKRRLIKSQDFNKNNSFLEVMQQFHKFLEE